MRPIPLSRPDVGDRERYLVDQVLSTPYLSMGPMVSCFEALVARYVGTRYAVAVSSGTAGLHLALIAAGVGPGDLVVTTPFSFVASANCILYVGATPVFVDIDSDTLNVDVHELAETVEALSGNPRLAIPYLPPCFRHTGEFGHSPKAILPVHIFGQPCAMEPLLALAKRYGLTVIEDACESIGAEYRGRRVGTFGRAAVFAFYPNKQVTTGEGGVIVTDDGEWAALFRSLRNQGRDDASTGLSTGSGAWLRHVRLGYNYRMPELSAALGVAQMERIEVLLAKRERVAGLYRARLREVEGVTPLSPAPTTTRLSWFVYPVRLAPEIDRDRVMDELDQQGVPSRPYFTPIHLQPFYRERFGYREGDFPAAEAAGRSTLALPFHANLSADEAARVVEGLKRAMRRARRTGAGG